MGRGNNHSFTNCVTNSVMLTFIQSHRDARKNLCQYPKFPVGLDKIRYNAAAFWSWKIELVHTIQGRVQKSVIKQNVAKHRKL